MGGRCPCPITPIPGFSVRTAPVVTDAATVDGRPFHEP